MGTREAKRVVTSEKLLPKILVTDCEPTLMNALEVVFPNSTHLLCLFHISKNVSMRCKEYVESNRHDHVMDPWNNIIYSNTKSEFLVPQKHFEVVCADTPKFFQYVHETWLTPYKDRFIFAWTNRVTHLGNTTTNMYVGVTLNMRALLIIK